MKSIGAILVAGVLAVGAGCARPDWIERTLVTVDVTGLWQGTMTGGTGGTASNAEIWLELKQEGPKLEGAIRGPLNRFTGIAASGPVEGTVGGDRIELRQTTGDLRVEATVVGDEMKSLAYRAGGSYPVYLRRTDSRSGSQPAKE